MNIIAAGVVSQVRSTVDKTLKLTFDTQELTGEDAGKLFSLQNKYVKILVSDDNITSLSEELVKNLKLTDTGKSKSPSQRLRSVLFRLHEKSQDPREFDIYYIDVMNIIIQHYMGKLE